MGWDLGLRDELSHLVTNAPRQIPDIAVSLQDRRQSLKNPDLQIWFGTPGPRQEGQRHPGPCL